MQMHLTAPPGTDRLADAREEKGRVMQLQRLVTAGVMMAAFAAVGMSTHVAVAQDDEVPYCYDLRTDTFLAATQWLTEPGTLIGTNGRDVLVGSDGDDVINGLGGNDVICGADRGSPADDDTADADFTLFDGDYSPPGLDTIYGGSGNDSIVGTGTLDGGSGNDIIMNALRVHPVDLEPLDDDEEYVTISLFGGTGNDELSDGGYVGEGVEVVLDCGPGNDKFQAFGPTAVINCEIPLGGLN
jgi:hypothetical protein